MGLDAVFSSENGAILAARAALEQSGIIGGMNPVDFDSSDPLKLWIVQMAIILIVCQAIAVGFKRIRQPKVIAEVIGGVFLGPSIMGHIPNFSRRVFPPASLPYLNLTATIALVLFLFLIGLETDVSTMRKLLRKAGPISAAGMLLPFGLGAAASVPIYNNFVDHDKVTFGHFLLFTCVALSITAFPVLCRILADTKLLEDHVGIVVLAAGVGNDVVGWVLLALTVALVNAGSGVTAVYVLLAGVAWTLFMLIPVRIAYRWIALKTGNLDGRGQPSTFIMMLTFIMVFASAFFTDIIGIHPIFGGFLAGLAIPHDGGLAIALTEKIEDLVTILLLPLYFAYSGLKTDLSTLNTGKAWGYTFLLIAVAFFGKFIGCFGSARVLGFNLRESGAIGALMSCKGLVELIVLNIGLQAGILDTRLFSMFVFMAIIMTLITTPLTLLIYPKSVRRLAVKTADSASDALSADKGAMSPGGNANLALPAEKPAVDNAKSKFTVVLERIEHLPAVMTVVQLLQQASSNSDFARSSSSSRKVDAFRLIELSERTSAVMRGADDAAEVLARDPLVNVIKLFTRINRLSVSSSLSIVAQDEYATSVIDHASRVGSDLIIIPWTASVHQSHESTAKLPSSSAQPSPAPAAPSYNPFAGLFVGALSSASGLSQQSTAANSAENSVLYSQFIRQVYSRASMGSANADVAVVIDRGSQPLPDGNVADGSHIFLPFFGGPDDRVALNLAVQLISGNPTLRATVVRVTKTEEDLGRMETADTIAQEKQAAMANNFTITSMNGNFPDTVYAHPTTETRMTSHTADHVLWSRLTLAAHAAPWGASISFSDISSPSPLQAALDSASTLSSTSSLFQPIIVVMGRGRRLAVESHTAELRAISARLSASGTGELRKTVGDVASAFVVASPWAMMVVQASASSVSAEV